MPPPRPGRIRGGSNPASVSRSRTRGTGPSAAAIVPSTPPSRPKVAETSSDRPGKDTGLLATAVAPAGSGKPAEEKAGKLELEASPTGQLAYTTSKAIAQPGSVTISMKNMSGVTHNVAIQSGTSGPVLGASSLEPKGTSSFTVKLKPGTYTFFCQAPGHRAAGMLGTLTVK